MLTSPGLLPDTKKPEWDELLQFITTEWWYVIYLAWAHIHWSIMATPPSLRSSRSSIEGSNCTISGNNLFSSLSSKRFNTSVHQFIVGVINGPQFIGVIIWINCATNPIQFVYSPPPSASVATKTLSSLCFFIKLRIFLTAPLRLGTSSLWPQIKSFLRRWTPRYGPPFAEPSLAWAEGGFFNEDGLMLESSKAIVTGIVNGATMSSEHQVLLVQGWLTFIRVQSSL